jgi:hypothetical protein
MVLHAHCSRSSEGSKAIALQMYLSNRWKLILNHSHFLMIDEIEKTNAMRALSAILLFLDGNNRVSSVCFVF